MIHLAAATNLQGVTCPRRPWLGWLRFGELSRLVGRYCSYLLPKQGGETSQIQVNKTQSTRTWDALYVDCWRIEGRLGAITYAEQIVLEFRECHSARQGCLLHWRWQGIGIALIYALPRVELITNHDKVTHLLSKFACMSVWTAEICMTILCFSPSLTFTNSLVVAFRWI